MDRTMNKLDEYKAAGRYDRLCYVLRAGGYADLAEAFDADHADADAAPTPAPAPAPAQ